MDASAVDAAEAGVPVDTGSPLDAGPWRPSFAPRLIYENRDVTCAPPPDFTYHASARPPVPPGTVRWAYRPARDPAARDRFETLGITQLILNPVPIVGTPGGLVVGFEERSFSLGITHDGRFDFAAQGYELVWSASSHAPVWFGTASEPRLIVDASQDYRQPRLTIEGRWSALTSIPSEIGLPLPGSGREISELVRKSRPAILADGSIVWAPTDRTIMASCPDGRTRWILEYDALMPHRLGIDLYAAADRTIILAIGPLYRLDYDGSVVAERIDLDDHRVITYSETCGLALMVLDRESDSTVRRRGMLYVRGHGFTTESWLPVRGVRAATSDCGVWADDESTRPPRFVRHRPDGSVGFSLPYSDNIRNWTALAGPPVELDNGTWLLLNEGGEFAPTITIIDDESGATVAQYPLDQSVIGESVVPGAYLLTPDGTLYLSTTSGLSDAHHVVAIELGVGARLPYASSPGLSWARTNATWHL